MDRRAPAGPDAARLIADAPAEDYALLELSLGWPGLDATQERVAAALRLFVITRDPLDWIPRRGHAWATANGDGDVVELPVYVALDAVRDAIAGAADLGSAVGRYGEAAVRTGAASEHLLVSGAHPGLAIAGRTPRLLEGLDEAGTFPSPAVTVASDGWEPLGLGAIQDLVQDAFGPVDLDRSLVRLDHVEPHEPGCAACHGEGFGFPAELDDARPLMCSPHRAAALAVTAARIRQAQESNPAGWRAMGKASARISGGPEPGGVPMPPRSERPPGRNDPCPCGSGRKYKRCCGA